MTSETSAGEDVYLLAPEPVSMPVCPPSKQVAPATMLPALPRWHCTAHGAGYSTVLLCLVVAWLVEAPVQLVVVFIAIGLALCCMDKNAPPCLAIAVTALAVVVLSVILLQVAGLEIVHLDATNSSNVTVGAYWWVFPSVIGPV